MSNTPGWPQFIERLRQQQPHEKCWRTLMARAERRLAELDDPQEDDPSVKAGEPAPDEEEHPAAAAAAPVRRAAR